MGGFGRKAVPGEFLRERPEDLGHWGGPMRERREPAAAR